MIYNYQQLAWDTYYLNTMAKIKVIDGIMLFVAAAKVGELCCHPVKYSALPIADLKQKGEDWKEESYTLVCVLTTASIKEENKAIHSFRKLVQLTPVPIRRCCAKLLSWVCCHFSCSRKIKYLSKRKIKYLIKHIVFHIGAHSKPNNIDIALKSN